MRLKALLRYDFITVRVSVMFFYLFYMVGNIVANVTVLMLMTKEEINQPYTYISIIGFVIAGLAVWYFAALKDTKFYLARSVSRKEAFTSHVITFAIFSAIMSILQLLSVYIVGLVYYLFGSNFLGLSADFQNAQAPDMDNALIFIAVNFSIILFCCALGYLLGILFNRWRYKAVGLIIVLLLIFSSMLTNKSFLNGVIDLFTFMFIDTSSGIWIFLKQIAAAAVLIMVTFVIMRKITTEKK